MTLINHFEFTPNEITYDILTHPGVLRSLDFRTVCKQWETLTAVFAQGLTVLFSHIDLAQEIQLRNINSVSPSLNIFKTINQIVFEGLSSPGCTYLLDNNFIVADTQYRFLYEKMLSEQDEALEILWPDFQPIFDGTLTEWNEEMDEEEFLFPLPPPNDAFAREIRFYLLTLIQTLHQDEQKILFEQFHLLSPDGYSKLKALPMEVCLFHGMRQISLENTKLKELPTLVSAPFQKLRIEKDVENPFPISEISPTYLNHWEKLEIFLIAHNVEKIPENIMSLFRRTPDFLSKKLCLTENPIATIPEKFPLSCLDVLYEDDTIKFSPLFLPRHWFDFPGMNTLTQLIDDQLELVVFSPFAKLCQAIMRNDLAAIQSSYNKIHPDLRKKILIGYWEDDLFHFSVNEALNEDNPEKEIAFMLKYIVRFRSAVLKVLYILDEELKREFAENNVLRAEAISEFDYRCHTKLADLYGYIDRDDKDNVRKIYNELPAEHKALICSDNLWNTQQTQPEGNSGTIFDDFDAFIENAENSLLNYFNRLSDDEKIAIYEEMAALHGYDVPPEHLIAYGKFVVENSLPCLADTIVKHMSRK